MTVTVHTIAKEDWKAGDYVICECCGAHLRHYAKSDGSTYGLNCAKSKGLIGKKMTAKKAQMISWEIETLKDIYNRGNMEAAESWARTVDTKLGLGFPYSENYVSQVIEAVS